MQRYLNQLLADIEMAIRSAPEHISRRVVQRFRDDEDFEDERLARHAAKSVRLSDLFGLNRYAFPPSEKLTKKQLSSLLTNIENLWKAWNIRWVAPPRLTARPRYTFMVEKMTADILSYDYEFGAKIDFCADKFINKCPFGDENLCYCKEVEASAAVFVETWEDDRVNRFLDSDFQGYSESPAQILDRWLRGDDPKLDPWLDDEDRERWTEFMAEEEMLTWLYFYQPRHPEIFEDEEITSPEDFEDFDWDEYDEVEDLPF